MRIFFLIILQFAVCTKAFSQKDSLLSLIPDQTIKGKFEGFTTDNLGNIYLINTSNQIKKLNDKGDSIAVYNDVKRYGNISFIDASNPLKLLVYYKDFATVVVLDRLLNVRNTIDLRKQDIFQVQAIATSYDGAIWLFDEQNSKIKKIDDYGKVIMESNDFRMIFDEPPQPQLLFDRDGQLYLYDVTKGIFVFDYYGAYKNRYSFKDYTDLQIIDKNTITARNTEYLILYKPLTLQMDYFIFRQAQHKYAATRFTGNRLYALTSTGDIEIFHTP